MLLDFFISLFQSMEKWSLHYFRQAAKILEMHEKWVTLLIAIMSKSFYYV